MNMSDNPLVLFLGGIHGVGKSTIAKRLASRLQVEVVSASQLIREARQGGKTWDSEKRVKAIPGNQEMLVRAFENREWNGPFVLLDGHYTLKNQYGAIEPLSPEVFAALSPVVLIVLTDKPDEIAARLKQRDGTTHDVSALAQMQTEEFSHAQRIGRKLDVRVIESPISSADSLIQKLKQLILAAE